MKKNNLILTAMLAVAMCFTACSGGNDDIEVNNVTLNETSLSLIVGDEFTLTATVLPGNATNQNVVWTSSNPAVARVANGVVTAITAGDATITAQAGSKTATCEVSIRERGVLINGVEWAKTNIDMPNTFAATPESYGMFYQWGRNIGWSENSPLVSSNGTAWNSTAYDGNTWTQENDPSPSGWRLPTLEDLQSLLDETKVASEWTTQNGVDGRKFTDIATGASIFLPAAGQRNYNYGSLNYRGNYGYYWSSRENSAPYAYYMNFYSTGQDTNPANKSFGSSIRCVAE